MIHCCIAVMSNFFHTADSRRNFSWNRQHQ